MRDMGKGKKGRGAMRGHETKSGTASRPMPKDGITKGNYPRQGKLGKADGSVDTPSYQPAV